MKALYKLHYESFIKALQKLYNVLEKFKCSYNLCVTKVITP